MKVYNITRRTKEFVWVRWEAYGCMMRGLSLQIPVVEFLENWKELPNKKASRNEKSLPTDKCFLCGKNKGEHLAVKMNCPFGKKTRIGYIYYDTKHKFTSKEINENNKYKATN